MKNFPIFRVRSNYDQVINNAGGQSLNIHSGDIGTFQAVLDPTASGGSNNSLWIEAVFNGRMIRLIPKEFLSPNGNGDIRPTLTRPNEHGGLPEYTILSNMVKGVQRRTTGSNLPNSEINAEFHNFQMFGIGKPSKKQSERRDKAKEKLEDFKDKVHDKGEDLKQKFKDQAQHIKNEIKDHNPVKAFKKATKKIHELVGKAKDAMKKRMRKAVLKRVSASITQNRHGIATRLLPAIVSESEAVKSKYKKIFIANSHGSYSEILAEWTKLGGTKATLDEAIKKGASHKRISLFKHNPYIPTTPGGATKLVKVHGIDGNGWDTSDYLRADGPEDDEIDENSVPDPSTEVETADETAALDAQGAADGVDTEEKEKGFKAFIQKILALFKKHKTDETPYEAGTPEAAAFVQDVTADKASLPVGGDGSQLDSVLNGTGISGPSSGKSGEEPTDDTILGIPKTGFFIGLGVLVLVGGILVYRKYVK